MLRVNADALTQAVRHIIAVKGDIGALNTAEPDDPEAFAFEISGPPQRTRQAIRHRGGRRGTRWVFLFPGLVSGQKANVAVPVHGTVWTVGSVSAWPAAANAVTLSAA